MKKLPPKHTCIQNLVRIDDRKDTPGGLIRTQKNFHLDWKKINFCSKAIYMFFETPDILKKYKHQLPD